MDDPLAIALQKVVLEGGRAEAGRKAKSGSGKYVRVWKHGRKRVRETRDTAAAPSPAKSATEGGLAIDEASSDEVSSAEVSSRLALESAVLALLVREMVPLVRNIPDEEIAAALSAADVTTGAARISALLTEHLVAKAPASDLMRAWLESARRKRELLEEAGGGLSAKEVAEIRDISRQAVERARREDRLLAVPLGAGTWRFPALQFDEDGNPLPGLETVLKAFRVEDPWMRLSELVAPDPELGNRSILSVLREEGEAAIPAALAAVREVA